MRMNKKKLQIIILIVFSVFCLIYLLNHSKTRTIGEIYSSSLSGSISNLNVTVFFDWGAKEFIVDNNENITKIIKIIENLKVRPILHISSNRDSIYYNNYLIKISSKDESKNTPVMIRISDDSNITVNNDSYRLVDSDELKQVFIYTILSQENTETNKYYFDLVNEIK